MNLSQNLLWGVDVAVKKLRPGANFQIEGPYITIWNCPNNSVPPTWEEINKQLEADRIVANQHKE